MILTALPVIPPELRPMVQLDGGRFATSDLNDLYRRVVNRNNRLKHLMKLQAPEVIIRNEKRMLQEAVDSLIDNSRRGKAISLRGRRQLKSLSDMLKGKQGRFRRNLLGKRVDYSGRSVIVVGPELKLHQCGLPRRMALELFRPFVMQKLVEYNYAINVKGAKRLVEREVPEVWEVLEEVIKTRPVLLNRAPTLHRLGIQAFEPVLVEGNAIQIHPLVCFAFNADFDGDQMAVHVPLSAAAVKEARELMLSSKNLLLPANGEPGVGPSKDMVLGCYWLTMEGDGLPGEGKVFSDYDEVSLAYSLGKVHLHARVKFYTEPGPRRRKRLIDTTVGRVLFNAILPPELRFRNEVMDKGALKKLVAEGYQRLGMDGTAELVDRIKDIGFRYATQSGVTIAIDDLAVPSEKASIIEQVTDRVAEVERQYRRGLITENEQYLKTVELWTEATEEVTSAVSRRLDPRGNIGVMSTSGAVKGGLQPIRQLAGMRGLMADPSGRIIPLPIRSNFREGLSTLEYFISTHGGRKGLADTALRTADAGYLTRRLVDVAQDVIINAEDCGTRDGIWADAQSAQSAGLTFQDRILGRLAASAIVHPKSGEILVEQDQMIDEQRLDAIIKAGIQRVRVRSPLTCQLRHGICARCYGRDLGRGEMVKVGEAVGIIAAQSIGEPGTQLTLRTFHTGGVAGGDITQGLPRVQELFEARIPKGEALIAEIAGTVHIERNGDERTLRIVSVEKRTREHTVPGNWGIKVEDEDQVQPGTLLAKRGEDQLVADVAGVVSVDGHNITIRWEDRNEAVYEVSAAARLRVTDGQKVQAGDQLTEGAKNPHEILRIMGPDEVYRYLVDEVQKVYRSQGVNINDKYIEIIVRQMMRRVRVRSAGDTPLLPGEVIDRLDFEELNAQVAADGGTPATATPILLGITKAALSTDSFLSAASFQHTISVLANAAIEGRRDNLHGLKESVIIGKLIPAGTGFDRSRWDGGNGETQPPSAGPQLGARRTPLDVASLFGALPAGVGDEEEAEPAEETATIEE
ncbi:MAG: DNA-directed RNA polymerase subunit beta', partial [Anaerolineae bacterium]|nr:DNA-directed RNA polymerase subunit beta' [Anaerolineae bacterium]